MKEIFGDLPWQVYVIIGLGIVLLVIIQSMFRGPPK